MTKDIRFFLVFLIIVLAVLAYTQNENFGPISNQGSLNRNNIQSSSVNKSIPSIGKDTRSDNLGARIDPRILNMNALKKKDDYVDKRTSQQANERIASKIDSILKNNNSQENVVITDVPTLSVEDNASNNTEFTNPIIEDVNNERNYIGGDEQALDELMREVNTGNDLIVNSPERDVYKSRSRSINSANKYRKVSYKDSNYRYDFNDEEKPNMTSQDELNNLYDNSLIFKNNEFNTNDNFKGFNETSENYGNANLKDFTPGKQTQKEKVLSLYNSNSYLPNNDLLDSQLTKGFQILDNPVAVSNPNLIPVLKSIPVSSVSGSTKNSTYDIRSEPPCPKTVVSPFLNSTIMPDIYATNRGCL
jgi:hypothetical protein